MKKILVPTDFSEGSLNALNFAINYAREFQAEILLVHAYNVPPSASTVMADITDSLRRVAIEEMEEFKTVVSKRFKDVALHLKYEVEYGYLVDVVNRMIEFNGIDTIFMGTLGNSDFLDKLLGSNTAAVMKKVHVPVFAIPGRSIYKKPERILFSSDFKLLNKKFPLEYSSKIANKFNTAIKFFHVTSEIEGENSERATKQAFVEDAEKYFPENRATFSLIKDEDIEKGIERVIRTENPDLLILVKHERGFFAGLFHDSVSKDILNSASIPILVLRD